jgi:hypothetical protein
VAEEQEKIESTDTPTGGEPASATPQPIDRQEYEQLKAFKSEYDEKIHPFIERVTPYYDDVEKFITQEPYREVARQSWQGFDAIEQSRKPEVPEYVKNLETKLDKVDKFVDTVQQRDYMASRANELVQLGQQHPGLAENNYQKLSEMIPRAQAIGITTVEQFIRYAKDQAPLISPPVASTPEAKPKPEPSKPKAAPSSLRGDASVPGLADTPQKVELSRKGVKRFIKQQVGAGGR